jgi:hypothetical protein
VSLGKLSASVELVHKDFTQGLTKVLKSITTLTESFDKIIKSNEAMTTKITDSMASLSAASKNHQAVEEANTKRYIKTLSERTAAMRNEARKQSRLQNKASATAGKRTSLAGVRKSAVGSIELSAATAAITKQKKEIAGLTAQVDRLTKAYKRMSGRGAGAFSSLTAGIKKTLGMIKKLPMAIITINQGLELLMHGFNGFKAIFKTFITDFIATGADFEDYKVRLSTVFGSVDEGRKILSDIIQVGTKVPYTIQDLAQAATMFAPIVANMGKGRKELMYWVENLFPDLAAVSGLSLQEVASNFVKASSAGIASADLFRERGISAMMGFIPKVSYSAKQTMDQIRKLIDSNTAVFAGAARAISYTWNGQISMMQDKLTKFKLSVMDTGAFTTLKAALIQINDYIDQAIDTGDFDVWASKWGQFANEELTKVIDGILAFVHSLTEDDVKKFFSGLETFGSKMVGWALKTAKAIGAIVNGINYIVEATDTTEAEKNASFKIVNGQIVPKHDATSGVSGHWGGQAGAGGSWASRDEKEEKGIFSELGDRFAESISNETKISSIVNEITKRYADIQEKNKGFMSTDSKYRLNDARDKAIIKALKDFANSGNATDEQKHNIESRIKALETHINERTNPVNRLSADDQKAIANIGKETAKLQKKNQKLSGSADGLSGEPLFQKQYADQLAKLTANRPTNTDNADTNRLNQLYKDQVSLALLSLKAAREDNEVLKGKIDLQKKSKSLAEQMNKVGLTGYAADLYDINAAYEKIADKQLPDLTKAAKEYADLQKEALDARYADKYNQSVKDIMDSLHDLGTTASDTFLHSMADSAIAANKELDKMANKTALVKANLAALAAQSVNATGQEYSQKNIDAQKQIDQYGMTDREIAEDNIRREMEEQRKANAMKMRTINEGYIAEQSYVHTLPDGEQAAALAEITAKYQKQREEVMQTTGALDSYEERLEKIAASENPVSFEEGWVSGIERVGKSFKSVGQNMAEMMESTASGMSETLSTSFVDVIKGDFDDIGDAFESLCDQILSDLMSMASSQLMQSAFGSIKSSIISTDSGIGGFFSSLFSSSAHGNVFTNGHIQAYAKGGIVSAPTFFKNKDGLNLMGEKGSEAILPLARNNRTGDLGVNANIQASTPNMSFNVINNTGTQATASQSDAQWDGQQWVVDIVMDAVSRNQSGVRDLLQSYN